ncbi:MAG: hypothetical protein WD648_07645 [Planctomycetaceae bacterium]
MNCDEAFNALTDATTDHGDELERHLRMCPRCRQMREVLSPALSLFLPTDSRDDADCFEHEPCDAANAVRKQFLSVEAVQIAKEAALALSSRVHSSPERRRRTVKWAAVQATVAAVAVMVSFAVFSMPTGHEPASTRQAAAIPGAPSGYCAWKERSRTDHSKQDAQMIVASCMTCHPNGGPVR